MLSSQISVPIRDTKACCSVCVFERAQNAMVAAHCVCCCFVFFYALSSFRSVFLCVCVCVCVFLGVHQLELVHICENQRQICLACRLPFSSPVDQSSIRERWEAFVKEALGVFLVLASLFLRYTTRLPNLLMNNTSSTEQVLVFHRRGSVKALDVFLPWRFECFSSSLTVCVCVCVCVCVYVSTRPFLFK